MADFTAEEILNKVRKGEKVERADLRGVILSKAVLENASFGRSDLEGANFEGAKLRKANSRTRACARRTWWAPI